jgi:hypothetical protein
MSASKTKTIRLSHDLADAGSLRAKELGYESVTALIEGLLRYDCLCRSSHGVTTQWAKLTGAQQDEIDGKMLARVLERKGMKAAEAASVDWRKL